MSMPLDPSYVQVKLALLASQLHQPTSSFERNKRVALGFYLSLVVFVKLFRNWPNQVALKPLQSNQNCGD